MYDVTIYWASSTILINILNAIILNVYSGFNKKEMKKETLILVDVRIFMLPTPLILRKYQFSKFLLYFTGNVEKSYVKCS